MIGVGGVSHKHYQETKGLKVCAGQVVKRGTIITRQGDKWKAGLNVSGKGSLQASCDGTVYFTHRRGTYQTKKRYTIVNVKPTEKKGKE